MVLGQDDARPGMTLDEQPRDCSLAVWPGRRCSLRPRGLLGDTQPEEHAGQLESAGPNLRHRSRKVSEGERNSFARRQEQTDARAARGLSKEDRTRGLRCPRAACRGGGRAEPAPAQAEADPLRICCLKGGFLGLQQLQQQGTHGHDPPLPEEQGFAGSAGAGAGTAARRRWRPRAKLRDPGERDGLRAPLQTHASGRDSLLGFDFTGSRFVSLLSPRRFLQLPLPALPLQPLPLFLRSPLLLQPAVFFVFLRGETCNKSWV